MKTGLIYHTDFKGYWVRPSTEDLELASKTFDEIILVSADENFISNEIINNRVKEILPRIPPGTKVIIGTNALTSLTDAYGPNLNDLSCRFPHLNFTGVYFNEESFFHPKFRKIWGELNKIKGRKVWIPYTGSFFKSMLTLPEIFILARKFNQVYVQPNYYQGRYGKTLRDAEQLRDFIKARNLGVEFEIDKLALKSKVSYIKAVSYFSIYKDIKEQAFYTGTMSLTKLKERRPRYFSRLEGGNK